MKNDGNLGLKEYILGAVEDREKAFKELTRLSEEDKKEYSDLLDYLEKVNSKRDNYTNEQKGAALENMVTFLINKTSVFEVAENLHTSTNEIDQLITLSRVGKLFKEWIEIGGEFFLGECKNYDGKVSVTWVGKFYSLLKTTSECSLGVLFSYHGLTGTGWNDATGLTKKLFLAKELAEKRIYIVDVNKTDFELIREGYNLIELLEKKMLALKTDTNIAKLISLHPAQESIKDEP